MGARVRVQLVILVPVSLLNVLLYDNTGILRTVDLSVKEEEWIF